MVELTWPRDFEKMTAPTLADIRATFEEWLGEAKRRGCPDDAPVHVMNQGREGVYDLAVVWDAGPPKTTGSGPLWRIPLT